MYNKDIILKDDADINITPKLLSFLRIYNPNSNKANDDENNNIIDKTKYNPTCFHLFVNYSAIL